MLYSIYQWGGLLLSLIGFVYGISGIGKIPFAGIGRYSDSVLNRIGTGLAIGSIWPFFLMLCVLKQVRS